MEPKDVYTLADLKNWDAVAGQLDPPARLSVFGDPVAHSLSPQLHNPALKAAGLDMQYVRVHVTAEEIPEALAAIRDLGFVGTNVTVPHKFTVMDAMDEVDDLARRLGAVNTVVFEDGKMLGFNSDGPGFVRAVRDEFHVDVRDLRVLVLGAGGGAGRAVAVQCAVEGCEKLALANRTREKAENLAGELAQYFHDERVQGPGERLEVVGWDTGSLRDELDGIDLVVNATSLGMKRTDPEIIPASIIQPHLMVYDMIYSPPRTKLLAAAADAGARGANGLSMLVHQGAISFEHWFNRAPPVDAMKAGIAAAVANG
jgi:shikimate dehydrogenase